MDSSPVEGMGLDNSVEQPHPQPQQALQPQQQQGIDFRQALSILSERSGQSESHRHDGCDSCHGSQIPELAKFMGQTIDLLAPTKPTVSGDESIVRDEAALHQERTERLEKIRQQLHTMTNTELLQAVRKSQEDRVTTYREYERYGHKHIYTCTYCLLLTSSTCFHWRLTQVHFLVLDLPFFLPLEVCR